MTILIITILFLSEPAQAYILDLSALDKNVKSGDLISLNASLQIEDSELIDVDYLILKLRSSNPNVSIECRFYPNGSILGGCPGITVILLSSALYGYGYGYGYSYGYLPGILRYNVVIDTEYYTPAKYNTYLGFVAGDRVFEKAGENIKINPYGGGGRTIKNSCDLSAGSTIMDKNIRGKNGTFTLAGDVLGNDKLSISVRSRGATRGSGYISAQEGRTRFSYRFKVTQVEDSHDEAKIYVSGSYRIGPSKTTQLDTVLVFDKKNSKASFREEGLSLSNMNLVFNGYGC